MTKPLGESRALGFWNKHLLAMDELYAYYPFEPGRPDEDLPGELLDIWNGPEREQVSKVFDQAELDAQALVRACVQDAIEWISQRQSPLRADVAVTRDRRRARAKIRPARGEYANRGEIWLTLSVENSSDGKTMTLYASLYSTKGGKRAGTALADALAGAVPGWKLPRADGWDSATAVFCRADLDQHRSHDGMSIDLDAARAAFNVRLREQDQGILRGLNNAAKRLMQAG